MRTLLTQMFCLMCHTQVLYLYENQIGDPGITALADALGKGALAQLKELNLFSNQIGDTGMIAFADAVRSGALDKLTVSWLPNALSCAHKSWYARSPDLYDLFDVTYVLCADAAPCHERDQ